MAYVFGSNFDQVAGQKNFYDNLNLRVAEQNRAAQQKAIDDQRQSMIFQQRQQEEDARQAVDQQYRFGQAQAQTDAQKRSENNAAYQFNAQMASKARGDAQKASEFSQSLDFSKQQAATQTGQKAILGDFNEAAGLVQNGAYDQNPEKIGQDYAHLAPQQLKVLNSLWDIRNKTAQDKFNALKTSADAATEFAQSGKMMPKDIFALQKGGQFRYSASPAGTNVSVVVPPPYLRPTTNAVPPVDASAYGGVFAPPPTPPQFMFGQSADTAETSTALPDNSNATAPVAADGGEAQGGYKIGTVYNGLKYLGGDLNDQSNWQGVR